MVASHTGRAAARLAGIVSAVQAATASTSIGTALRGELVVDAKQQFEELRVLQQGVAHWIGLLLWSNEAP
jgi:hypothetical protein